MPARFRTGRGRAAQEQAGVGAAVGSAHLAVGGGRRGYLPKSMGKASPLRDNPRHGA